MRKLHCLSLILTSLLTGQLNGQVLLNIDFGAGQRSAKVGLAATGQSTNDFWNLYRHYDPKFVPSTPLVYAGRLENLKLADGTETRIALALTNAPGVWGNSSGDPMYDTYIFADNGSNIVVTISGLEPGRYHFYLYGHADPDVTGEQNSAFTLRSGTNNLGSLVAVGSNGWKATTPWREQHQYVVFRDVSVESNSPVVIEAAAGPNGVAVLNGLQIFSRGTSPPRTLVAPAPPLADSLTNLVFHSVRYRGHVTETEARFLVELKVESVTTNEISATLFEGDVALVVPELPRTLRILSAPQKYLLVARGRGVHDLKLEVVSKINRAEPWNRTFFKGPEAAVATVEASAAASGIEMQLLSGTALSDRHRGVSRIEGVLAADRLLDLRWQSKTAEVTRKTLVSVDTSAQLQLTPTVVKYQTQLRYGILQAGLPRLRVSIPASHTVTKIQGEGIRDWNVEAAADQQLLTVDFIKPVEKSYILTLLTEQGVETTPREVLLALPQPLDIERESGALTVSTEAVLATLAPGSGLRQVNAPAGALASFRFHTRPVSLSVNLRPVEPVLKVADRVTARVDDTRLLVSHALKLNVEKAGIYQLEASPQPGFTVLEVQGEGLEDWKMAEGKLRIHFAAQVLGERRLTVHLEQTYKALPPTVTLLPLRVAGATNETATIGAAAVLGVRLKTAGELSGLREIPVHSLPERTDEALAFAADQGDWSLTLAAERLPARVVAEVFNLVTIGDGLVGGSATLRYGIINQGVQEFRISLPAHWKNVEFTGANIRRKEPVATADTNQAAWVIALQDKAWGGYTLVVTYDYQFDPREAVLDLRGAHALGVERETGSLAVTVAANLKLQPGAATEPLRLIDGSELAAADRALITRPVLVAYRYTGSDFVLSAAVTRHAELPVLEAVADRTQLTTVLTADGQMLTQASFMVKNNEKQYQRFQLPGGAELWGCYVNNEPVKAEQDGAWTLVSLPRAANRDEAFAVDLVYRQKVQPLDAKVWPRSIALTAPRTDVPNTYAEWQLFVPADQRISRFGGNMIVARGVTYTLRDAVLGFVDFYRGLLRRHGVMLGSIGALLVVGFALTRATMRRGLPGLGTVLVVVCIGAVLAGMLLPALSKAKAKSSRIQAVSNLKQVGLAARLFAEENGRFPTSFEEIKDKLGSERLWREPGTQLPFVYVGAGKDVQNPQAILAYSPTEQNGLRVVCFADGSVSQMSANQFTAALHRDGMTAAGAFEMSQTQENRVRQQQESLGLWGAAVPQLQAGGVAASTNAFVTSGAPTAAGLRSIRIEIPRTGNPVTFTKVLNVNDKPLFVTLGAMKLRWFVTWRSVLQLAVFVIGVLLAWYQWRQAQPSSLGFALGLALALAGVAAWLVSLRALHLVLIFLVPAALAGLMAWLAVRWWRHSGAGRVASEPQSLSPEPGPSGATALLALLGLLVLQGNASVTHGKELASAPVAVTNTWSILSGVYTGHVSDHVATFTVTLRVATFATNVIVPLFGNDVALQEFSADIPDAKLLRQGQTVALRLGPESIATVRLKLAARLAGDAARRQVAFAIPPALSSQLAVTIAEPEADVEFPSAVSFQRHSGPDATRIEAILGAGDRVDLAWTPRVKRIADMAASVFVHNATMVRFGGGAVSTRTTFDYQIAQGELRQAKVRIPSGQRLLRVEGDLIRVWELLEEEGSQILHVDLLKGVSSSYKLTIETEAILDKVPAQFSVSIPAAANVIRETGLVGVTSTEDLSLTVEAPPELRRVDAAELAKVGVKNAEGLAGAWRFLKPNFQLGVRAEAVTPLVEVVSRNFVHVEFEQLQLTAELHYTIKKAGVFTLPITLPAGYRVEQVSGENIAQWTERADETSRVLEVAFKERVLGSYSLRLVLLRTHKDLPAKLELTALWPIASQKLSGFMVVTAEPGIQLKTGTFAGLIEVAPAQASIPSGMKLPATGVLAYKFVQDASQPPALTLSTEVVDSWIRAELANVLTVTETLLTGRATIRYEIQNAPTRLFRIRVPASYGNVEFYGANIRRRDQVGEEWRIELQNKVRGTYTLSLTWEEARTNKAEVLAFTGPQATNVEREVGTVIVLAKSPLQVSERTASEGLLRSDAREIPDWVGLSYPAVAPEARPRPTDYGDAPALVYRYLRPGYVLGLEVKRFNDAALLQALVESLRLTTIVADDGQLLTQMALSVRNNGLQHLEIELPANMRIWSAFVAGQPVRPSQRAGKLLLPIERSGSDEAPVAIELTYVGTDRFPQRKGKVTLASPRLDVPIKNARWELYLPPDYDYEDFSGTMTHESELAPAVQVYSSSEYRRQEAEKQVARKSEISVNLGNARRRLSAGEVKEANEEYAWARNRSKSGALTDEKTLRELEGLKRDLSKIQGSNLIEAQRAYTLDNLNRYNLADLPAQEPAQQSVPMLTYDAEVAERQAELLQRAQEVTTATIQPLHINLPTRGVRHAFSQVLQTEINKPMVVEFTAENAKTTGWFKSFVYLTASFLMLWMFVSVVLQRTHRPNLPEAQHA